MADSKVEIQVTANTDEAKRSLADLEIAADRAMDAGANSAKKLAKSLDEVSASAKASGNEIRMAAKALGGMAIGLAVNRMTQSAGGDSPTAAYLKGAVGPALSAGLMTKNPYVAAGAAGIGIIDTYFQRKDQGKREASEMNDLADALEKAREQMAAARERADGFAATMEKLGDVSRNVQQREAERAAEIEKRQNAVSDATERMAAAEKALRDQAASISGPQTEEQKKAADRIREAWAAANQDLQTAQGELDRLKGTKIEAAKPASKEPLDKRGDGPQVSALEKLGAKFGGALQGGDKGDAIVGAVDNLAPAFADGAQDVAGAVDAAAKDVSRAVSDSLGGLVFPPPEVRVEAPAPPPAPTVDAAPVAGAVADAVGSLAAPPPAPTQTPEEPQTDAGANAVSDASRSMAATVALAVQPLGPVAEALGGLGGAFADAVASLQRTNFGSATDALDRESNRIAGQQLDVLRVIAEKTGNAATFA